MSRQDDLTTTAGVSSTANMWDYLSGIPGPHRLCAASSSSSSSPAHSGSCVHQRSSEWPRARPTIYLYKTALTLLIIISTLVAPGRSIAIDNDIIGEPEIECQQENIRFWINTRKFFAGRFYAKSKSEVPGCLKNDYAQQRTNKPFWDIPFGNCGMKGLRSLEPRGMYYGITVVVSFHPLFITKVDQVFHVKCFFEESNRGLTAELGVSMIPTTEVQAKHTLPGCTYSMHKSTIRDLDEGRPAGEPVKFARVGDKVLHQWACDDPMFGLLINNCYVTDGFGQRAEVVDARGCPIDPILITGIRYSADLMRAYAESHVFKFADKPGVWFFCQIQMCMKAAGMCQGISPPVCDGSSVGGPVGGYVPSTMGYGNGLGPGPGGPGNVGYIGGGSGPSYNGGGGGGNAVASFPSTARPLFPYTIGGPNNQAGGSYGNSAPTRPNQQQGQYAQQPGGTSQTFTPFAPAYPTPDGGVGNAYPVLSNQQQQGVPVGSVRKKAFDVTTTYETELPRYLLEQNDTPGVGIEDAVNGGWTTAMQPEESHAIDINKLLEVLPDEFRDNEAMKKFIIEHKEDQKFLMNALYRARNPGEDDGLTPGERIDSFDVTMLAPSTDELSDNEIAGQLIIFDLDEDPPAYLQKRDAHGIDVNGTYDEDFDVDWESARTIVGRGRSRNDPSAASALECVITSRNLLLVISSLAGSSALFMFITCAMCMRYCRGGGGGKNFVDEYDQKALPYDRYHDRQHKSRSKSQTRGGSHQQHSSYRHRR